MSLSSIYDFIYWMVTIFNHLIFKDYIQIDTIYQTENTWFGYDYPYDDFSIHDAFFNLTDNTKTTNPLQNDTCKSFSTTSNVYHIAYDREQDREKYYKCCHICEEACFLRTNFPLIFVWSLLRYLSYVKMDIETIKKIWKSANNERWWVWKKL